MATWDEQSRAPSLWAPGCTEARVLDRVLSPGLRRVGAAFTPRHRALNQFLQALFLPGLPCP